MSDKPKVRWRDRDTGKARSGFLMGEQLDGETYRVGIPNWITGTVDEMDVLKVDAVLGDTPWPDDR